MSVKNLIAKFDAERATIATKIAALKERDGILELMLKELRAASTEADPKPAARTASAKKKAPAAGKKSGGHTVRDAILHAVSAAKEAIPANEIIAEAARLSGGAVASIRTQINALTRGGLLKQEPYEGRGFKYKAVKQEEAKPAAAEPKAKAKK